MDKFLGVVFVTALLMSVSAFGLSLHVFNSRSVPILSSDALPLTILEVMVGVIAIVLALGAFGGFWLIRSAAVYAAREEAEKQVRKMQDEGLLVLAARPGNTDIPPAGETRVPPVDARNRAKD